MSDHSPVFLKIDFDISFTRGNYGWKFNSLLLEDEVFVTTLQDHLKSTIDSFGQNSNPHIKWEFLKYEARKFCISYSKRKRSADKILEDYHENIIQQYESTEAKPSESLYFNSKLFIENVIEKRTKGAILHSKSQWYENSEKSTKFFFNLEKKNAINSTVKKVIDK